MTDTRIVTAIVDTEPGPVTPLTAADRCDRCSAAARIRTVLPSGLELLFCRHHYNEFGTGLRAQGAAVYDDDPVRV